MPRESAWIDPGIIDELVERTDMTGENERNFRYRIRLYADFLESRGVPFEAADREDLRLFFDHMSLEYSPATSRQALSAARRLHKWAESTGMERIGMDVRGASRIRGEGVRKPLSPAQARAVMQAAEGARNAALIGLMLEAALKPGEILAANVGDVTFFDGWALLLVKESASRPASTLRMPRSAASKLRRYLESRGETGSGSPLVASESNRSKGERLTARSMRQIVQGIFAKADIPGTAGDYDMRKSAILLARDQGATDEELMRFARLRTMSTIRDCDNLYRYAADAPQERIERALEGWTPSERSRLMRASDLRRMLERFPDDEGVVVSIDEGGALTMRSIDEYRERI